MTSRLPISPGLGPAHWHIQAAAGKTAVIKQHVISLIIHVILFIVHHCSSLFINGFGRLRARVTQGCLNHPGSWQRSLEKWWSRSKRCLSSSKRQHRECQAADLADREAVLVEFLQREQFDAEIIPIAIPGLFSSRHDGPALKWVNFGSVFLCCSMKWKNGNVTIKEWKCYTCLTTHRVGRFQSGCNQIFVYLSSPSAITAHLLAGRKRTLLESYLYIFLK